MLSQILIFLFVFWGGKTIVFSIKKITVILAFYSLFWSLNENQFRTDHIGKCFVQYTRLNNRIPKVCHPYFHLYFYQNTYHISLYALRRPRSNLNTICLPLNSLFNRYSSQNLASYVIQYTSHVFKNPEFSICKEKNFFQLTRLNNRLL